MKDSIFQKLVNWNVVLKASQTGVMRKAGKPRIPKAALLLAKAGPSGGVKGLLSHHSSSLLVPFRKLENKQRAISELLRNCLKRPWRAPAQASWTLSTTPGSVGLGHPAQWPRSTDPSRECKQTNEKQQQHFKSNHNQFRPMKPKTGLSLKTEGKKEMK